MIQIIEQPESPTWTRNPVFWKFLSTNADGTPFAGSPPDNYQVCVEVWFQADYNSGTYERVVTLKDTPDENGCTSFDLQYIVEAETKCSKMGLDLPSTTASNVYLADNLRQYYLVYFEKYGTPIEPQPSVQTVPQLVIAGGIDQKRWLQGERLSQKDQTTSLLSWMPKNRDVSPNLPNVLHWYNYTDTDQAVYLQVDFFDNNSSTPIGSISTQDLIVPNHQTATFPAGYTNLGIENLHPTTEKYCLQVMDLNTNQPLSPKCCYTLDCYPYACEKYLVYQNSFCLPESVRLTGYTTTELEIERQFSENANEQMQQWCYDFQHLYTCRTGYFSKAEIQAMQEMLIYNEVYILEENEYCAYLINTNKFNITECLQFLHSLTFEAMRATKAINYSP